MAAEFDDLIRSVLGQKRRQVHAHVLQRTEMFLLKLVLAANGAFSLLVVRVSTSPLEIDLPLGMQQISRPLLLFHLK